MIKGKITISRPSCSDGKEVIVIKVKDENAVMEFLSIELSYENFTKAITGQGYIDCEFEVGNLDKVGKIRKTKKLTFQMPEDVYYTYNREEIAYKIACEKAPKGWEVDKYFRSQDSFTYKDGKLYANAILHKWENVDNENNQTETGE